MNFKELGFAEPSQLRVSYIIASSLNLQRKKEKKMKNEEFMQRCKEEVRKYAEEHLDKSDVMPDFDVYVVWSCKTLQNSKALLSTSLSDGMYYELTMNGDKEELYFDAYKKFENKCIKLN